MDIFMHQMALAHVVGSKQNLRLYGGPFPVMWAWFTHLLRKWASLKHRLAKWGPDGKFYWTLSGLNRYYVLSLPNHLSGLAKSQVRDLWILSLHCLPDHKTLKARIGYQYYRFSF